MIRINFNTPRAIHKKFKLMCVKNEVSISEVLSKVMYTAVKENKLPIKLSERRV